MDRASAAPERARQGSVTAQAELARVGSLLDAKWHLDALLGRGGMATVYAATHRTTRARAAVKVLHLEFAQDIEVRDRFLREARIANSIQHPARVAVLDEGVSDQGELFLVMDLLEGTTLDLFMRQRGASTSLEDKLRIFDPILDLLGECHAAAIVHRDIKPANIFMTSQGQIKVLDFGIARLRENSSGIDPTRQGTVLGTPAYMAPEQALGLTELVDGRADLWSVGACMYTLVTGKRVHRARSENESMVMAATSAAESIATVMPDLPVEVVSFIDKSLAHDRAHRFADAHSMRSELAVLLAALRTGQVTHVKKKRGDALVMKSEVTVDEEALASPELKALTLERMRAIWKFLGLYLSAAHQYGAGHPKPTELLQSALDTVAIAVADRPESVVWEITPYAFAYAGEIVWETDKVPFDRLPYRLFSHGLRKVQLRRGITVDELGRLIAVTTRDKNAGLSLTDDPVADLWAQRFEHVAYQAIDSIAMGDADDVEGFEAEAEEVAHGALEISMIAKGWEEFQNESLESRALQANLVAGLQAAATVASDIALDLGTRAALGAQVAMSPEKWMDRYVDVLALSLIDGTKGGDVTRVASALAEWTAEQIVSEKTPATFELFGALRRSLAAESTEQAGVVPRVVAAAMFDDVRLGEALRKLRDRDEGGISLTTLDPNVLSGIEEVLALRQEATFFDAAVDHWVSTKDVGLKKAVTPYIRRRAADRDAAFGARLETASEAIALGLLELSTLLGTEAASQRVAPGLKSPHVEVRRAALRALPEADTGDEAARLLTDPDGDLRCEALRFIAKRKVRSVGPHVVRRIQQESFASLPSTEKRDWLLCLLALNATRAEEVAIEMLSHAPMIPTDTNDRNRVLALEVLANAESEEAVGAIKKAARAGWWNSPLVRDAAQRTAAAIASRQGGGDVTQAAESPRPSVAPQEGDGASAHIEVLGAFHRLLKMTRIYEDANQALVGAADALVMLNVTLCNAERLPATDLMFASETAFVNGRMLRLSRDAYARTMELADLLDKAGVSSVTLPSSTTGADALAFTRTVVAALQDEGKQRLLTDKAGVRGVRARRLRRQFGSQASDGDRSAAGRVVRTYACTVVLLRRIYVDYAASRLSKVPPGLTRVAQRIVGHAEDEPGLLVALASAPTRESDEAAVSASTALVATLMARQLTKERALLASITQAALLYHLGQTRVIAGRAPESQLGGVVSPLREDERDRLAASTVAAMSSLDKVDAANAQRAVIAFEAHWQKRSAKLGPAYRGTRSMTVLGRILAVARTFAELMAPGPYATAMGPADAIQFLESKAEDESDRTYVKLLTGGLGIFPVGTVVELSTGEVGVVMRVPDSPARFSRPEVRVMYDASGDLCASPLDVDLASAEQWGATQRVIRRAVDADAQQTQAMRAYVLSVTRGDSSVRREARAVSPASDSRPRAMAPAPALRQTGADELTLAAPSPLDPVRTAPAPAMREAAPPSLLPPLPPLSSSLPLPPLSSSHPLPPSSSSPALPPTAPSAAPPPSPPSAPPSSGISVSAAPSSPSSTTGRRRRAFVERPKVFDPRAEPEDGGTPRVELLRAPASWNPARSPADASQPPPSASPPHAPASARSATSQTASAEAKAGPNTIPTRPAMAAVTAPTKPELPAAQAAPSVHERPTDPPPTPRPGASSEPPVFEPRLVEGVGDEPPILELPPLDDDVPAPAPTTSHPEVTRSVGWQDIAAQLMDEAAPNTPRPGDEPASDLDWGELNADAPPSAPQARVVPKSSVAGTRKANWHEYGKLIEGAAPAQPKEPPARPRLDPSAYDEITDDDDPQDGA